MKTSIEKAMMGFMGSKDKADEIERRIDIALKDFIKDIEEIGYTNGGDILIHPKRWKELKKQEGVE